MAMAASSSSIRNLVLLAILVVTAFVVATVLGLGGSDGSEDAATTTTAPPTTAPPTTAPTTTTIALPDGDYTALCAQLKGLVDSYGSSIDPEKFEQLFAALDFDALIAASPDGTRVYVETLRDQRQQVLDVLAEADSPEDLPASTLPPSFFDAIQQLQAVAVQKCGFTGG